MAWAEKLFSFIEEYRKQFKLKTHTHEESTETLVEIWSESEQIVRVKGENRENTYKWAYDLLEIWVNERLAEIEEFLRKL